MESSLSHDSYPFVAPNALHGALSSAPNLQNPHVHPRPIETIPTMLRRRYQQSSMFAPRLPEDYPQQFASTSTSPMYNGFSAQQQQQLASANAYKPSVFNNIPPVNNTISPMKLTPLSLSAVNPHNRSLQPSPTSSSPSSASSRTPVFSRRSDGVTGSPPRTGNSDVVFCRTANPHGRQRTAQACEKCRDRKTKCSGERPVCKRCKDRGLTCEWAPETRVRGPQRMHKSSRLSSEEKDSPKSQLSILPAPYSHPNTPLNPTANFDVKADVMPPRSAPPQIPGFPPLLNTSGKLIGVVVDPRRSTWPPGLSSAVQQGEDAKMIMGQPIVSITPSSDCWKSIADAEVVDAAEYMTYYPNSVSLFNHRGIAFGRGSAGESGGNSDSSSPPSIDTHTLSASSSNEIHDFSHPAGPATTDGHVHLDHNMTQMFNANYPSSATDPSLLGMFGDHSDFAHAAVMNSGTIADDTTPMPNGNAKRDEDFMKQFFNTEAFEQS